MGVAVAKGDERIREPLPVVAEQLTADDFISGFFDHILDDLSAHVLALTACAFVGQGNDGYSIHIHSSTVVMVSPS